MWPTFLWSNCSIPPNRIRLVRKWLFEFVRTMIRRGGWEIRRMKSGNNWIWPYLVIHSLLNAFMSPVHTENYLNDSWERGDFQTLTIYGHGTRPKPVRKAVSSQADSENHVSAGIMSQSISRQDGDHLIHDNPWTWFGCTNFLLS